MSIQRLPAVAPARLRQLVDRFRDQGILVVGDVMLDRFLVGRVTRISPEAPVPVVAHDHDTYRIGGAANVAANVAALGGTARLVGVVGNDADGALLPAACRDAGIHPALVDDARRRTTTKVRIVTERNQQVVRIDYESDAPIDAAIEERVIAGAQSQAEGAAAIVVSDYLKGSITARVMQTLVALGTSRGIPVLVDPKIPHVASYRGATIITPNHHEAESATHTRVRTHEDAQATARAFRDQAGCRGVLMTRGDQGIWLLDGDAEGHLPAVAREVADVTGAGDTVIATFALALAAGATAAEAAFIANQAAGLVVANFGPATVTTAELREATRSA